MKCNTYILKSKISRVFKTVIYILECLTDSFWEMNRKVRILYIQKNGRIKKIMIKWAPMYHLSGQEIASPYSKAISEHAGAHLSMYYVCMCLSPHLWG